MGIGTGTALLIAGGVAAGTTIYAVEKQKSEGAKARRKAEQEKERERKWLEEQAGEYQEIGERQMAIQAMQAQTRTLADLLDQDQPAPRILTMPTTQSPDPMQRINRAIDDFVKGRYG